MTFCVDADLLYWEPGLFKEAAAVGQTLFTGTAAASGPAVLLEGGASFSDISIAVGNVLTFSGVNLVGSFGVVTVVNEAQVRVSVLYDGLDAEGKPPVLPVGDVSGQALVIRTFYPQRKIMTQLLMQAAGLDPEGSIAAVMNPEVLKRACVVGTLQLIYTAMAATATNPAAITARADLYGALYARALRSAKVEIDCDGDGKADVVRSLNAIRLRRA